MNARRISLVVLLGFTMGWMATNEMPQAQAEWYRPMTWGQKKPAARSSKKKNSGIVGGTKQALTKTADALTPWDNKKKDNPHDGAARFFRPDIAHRKKQNEPTWYRPATWFNGEPEPEKPLTVTDWMALDRPEFENR
jgi:hypothetical protein